MATRETSEIPHMESGRDGGSAGGATQSQPRTAEQRAPTSLGRFDHVAIEIAAFDATIDELVATGSMRLIRLGTVPRTGRRVALLGDGTGVKIELMENPEASTPQLAHLAFRCSDMALSKQSLEAQGWRWLLGPHTLSAAKADSALFEDAHQLRLQIIRYDDSSPDLVEWQNA